MDCWNSDFMLMLGRAAHGRERADYSADEQGMLTSLCAHVLEASVDRGLPDEDADRFIEACQANDESIGTLELAVSIIARLTDDDIRPIVQAHGWSQSH